ncbi:MAG: ATP-binding protein [Pseudomonadota bacterium]
MKPNASFTLSGDDLEIDPDAVVGENDHYLEKELFKLVGDSPAIFHFLKSSCLDGIWYWDLTDLGQEWLSPRFKAVFGYEDHEMENTPDWWQANIHADDLTTTQENFERHKADPDHPFDQIVRYRHRDGSTVWVRCRGLILRDKAGIPMRMIGAHTDVTALKLAERDLQIVNESLSQFAAVASHDLQAPLRQIGYFADMLREDAGHLMDDRSIEHLDRIESGIDRMRELIRSFLDFSRMESGSFRSEPLSLSSVMTKAVETLADRISESGATISVPEDDVTIIGDETLLSQVMVNLVDNAIKYRSDNAPQIAITWARKSALFDVSVTDNGKGIDPKFAQRVFELFARADAGVEAGSGIGLAFCKRAINRHGGEIWLDTDFDGPGSRFMLSVPAA